MIRVLPSEVVDRIAAGEVVERPASVVKEIVENSLDAGAGQVHVDYSAGGVERIEVSDDGAGMSPEEALLALRRHATSKIRSERDLLEVGSFGFRGEALPSIASVSRMTLMSRARGADSGTRIRVEGGRVIDQEPAGLPEGSRVRIRDLFYNTPARLKFLKTERTESARLGEVVRHLALAHPTVAFLLTRDGEQVGDWPAAADWQARAAQIWRKTALHPLESDSRGIRVRAMLSGPAQARRGTAGLVLLVNGRSVVDRGVAGAVAAAYEGALESGRWPQGVVHLEVPAGLVDVNVHPQKRELRFSDPRAVTGAVYSSVARWAASTPWNPRVARPTAGVRDGPSQAAWSTGGARSAGARRPEPPARPMPSLFDMPAPAGADPGLPAGFSGLRVAGRVLGTYLVCDDGDEVVFIDQHAAAERVTFERLRRTWREGAVVRQRLLVPAHLDVEPGRAALVEENEGLIRAFGIEAGLSGPDRASVTEVPALLAGADPALLLAQVLDELADARGRLDSVAEQVLATMACHASVRAGDVIDESEARALLADLDAVDWAAHCPHGRPVSFRMTRAEIERRFARR